jgi:hypothetical protein
LKIKGVVNEFDYCGLTPRSAIALGKLAMPSFFKIDKERRFVLSSGNGILNREEALAHQVRLLSDPDFDPSYSQLVDFTQITQFDLSAEDIRQMAQRKVFSPDSRRAILVPNEHAYGLGQMFESLRDAAGERGIRVFRKLEEALDWVLSKQEAS